MEQSLFFEGKEYVSSKRASQISKYTKDYVGQLCRGGKLNAKLVGRNWYVDLDSLHTHMGDSSSRPKESSVQDFLKKDLTIGNEDKKPQKTSFFVNHFKQKHAQAVKKDPQLAWREIDHNRKQEKILTDMDVAYEEGSPIFFADERPLYPTPLRSTDHSNKNEESDDQSLEKDQQENQDKESDTTIFFKANLVSGKSHTKSVVSPIQLRTTNRQSYEKKGKSLDSIVPTSRPSHVRTNARSNVHPRSTSRRKKSYVKAYGLVLIVLGTALLAGSVFMSLRGVGSMSYTAQIYTATNNN